MAPPSSRPAPSSWTRTHTLVCVGGAAAACSLAWVWLRWHRQGRLRARVEALKACADEALRGERTSEAIGLYAQAIALADKLPASYKSLVAACMCNWSAALACAGMYARALEEANNVLVLCPDLPKGHLRRGTALLGLSKQAHGNSDNEWEKLAAEAVAALELGAQGPGAAPEARHTLALAREWLNADQGARQRMAPSSAAAEPELLSSVCELRDDREWLWAWQSGPSSSAAFPEVVPAALLAGCVRNALLQSDLSAPFFRGSAAFRVYGCAQPTPSGLHHVVSLIQRGLQKDNKEGQGQGQGNNEGGAVVWVDLRDGPDIVFVNDHPYTLGPDEDRKGEDIASHVLAAEGVKCSGHVLPLRPRGGTPVVVVNVPTAAAECGLVRVQVPIVDDELTSSGVDSVMAVAQQHPNAPLLFTCRTGLVPTTAAMTIACLTRILNPSSPVPLEAPPSPAPSLSEQRGVGSNPLPLFCALFPVPHDALAALQQAEDEIHGGVLHPRLVAAQIHGMRHALNTPYRLEMSRAVRQYLTLLCTALFLVRARQSDTREVFSEWLVAQEELAGAVAQVVGEVCWG